MRDGGLQLLSGVAAIGEEAGELRQGKAIRRVSHAPTGGEHEFDMGCTRKSRSFNCHRKSSTANSGCKTSDIFIRTAENGDIAWHDWPVIALSVFN